MRHCQKDKQAIHQGISLPSSWTEVEFKMNLQEGLTLIIFLTSEKEQ